MTDIGQKLDCLKQISKTYRSVGFVNKFLKPKTYQKIFAMYKPTTK